MNIAIQRHWERGRGAFLSLFVWAIAEGSTELTFHFKGLKQQWQRSPKARHPQKDHKCICSFFFPEKCFRCL